jgi:hypothetical protein
MPAAQKARLLDAIDDYLRAVGGDGGRGPRRAQLDGPDAELAKAAQGLRDLAVGQGGEQPSTPGRRSAGHTGGQQQGDRFHALADRARDMMGASTAGTDGAGVG